MFRSKSTTEEAMKNQNDLALILSQLLFSTKAKHSNTVFSPASINAALTLAASGPDVVTLFYHPFDSSASRPGGSSAATKEILSFLRSSSIDELNSVFSKIVSVVFTDHSANGGPKISSVNGVWIEQSLPIDDSSFKDIFEKTFKASFDRVDFRSKAEEVCVELNSWASSHTNGLIKDLLPHGSVTEETDVVYGNALYFKGQWEKPFDKSYTRDKEFHLLDGTSVSVPFMSSYKNQYIKAYDGFKVLRIPYRQSHGDTNRISPYRQGGDDTNRGFSMYFYLPDKKDGLDHLVKTMASTYEFLDGHVPIYQAYVNEFRIPKFKIADGLSGGDLGFSAMPLFHKACIEIDEEGAEAAAATFCSSGGGCGFMPPPRIDFVADHPFLFLIREDTTGTVLFVGQIFHPSQTSS
ncbi:unnamed protein product [Microthlaspi erraticum]|uniref:Serpin domain-containing protein n=1 Tax=Microthlaspi erraticum TaxID=1685480 RepID=A0A6D2HMQ6_9BRAS|nr:unnamed protein product [Microthlaspi erraticum]